MKIFCVFIAIFAVAAAASENDGLLTTALKFVKDCGDKSMVLCMKVRKKNKKVKKVNFTVNFMDYQTVIYNQWIKSEK